MKFLKFPIHPVVALVACQLSMAAPAEDDYNVVWDSPGKGHKDSMPIGNGDLGINLWTEVNGDVVFLIGKSDAWTENSQLVKLRRVRVTFDTNPFKKSGAFRQFLKPRAGEIEIRGESNAVLHAWVDANAAAIHLEFTAEKPVSAQAVVELWRNQQRRTNIAKGNSETERGFRESNGNPEGFLTIDPDTVLPAKGNRLMWLHHNSRSLYPGLLENQHLEPLLAKYPDPLLYRNFGATMNGDGFVSVDDRTLKTSSPQRNLRLDVVAFTNQSERIEDWRVGLGKLMAKVESVPTDSAREATRRWWRQFWERSWIKVSGDETAEKVTQVQAMQRWMAACGGRAAKPMKYNGSIFTVCQEPAAGTTYDPNKGQQDADYRA